MAADFEAREASRRCSCASRSAAEMLRVWSVIDWRFQQREAQGLMLLKGGLWIKRLTNHKESQEADQRVEILRVSDLGSFVASALTHRQKETPALAGDAHQGLERLALVFVQLASLALSQGWIGRAKVAHQAVLIVRRKASITTPLHACVQGAIERLSRSDRHVTLRIGSTDIGIVFPLRDQKNTNLVRDSTQMPRLSSFRSA